MKIVYKIIQQLSFNKNEMNMLNKIKNENFAIVTHVYATGPAQELEIYLRKRVDNLIYIGHPFSYAKDIRSFYIKYNHSNIVKNKKFMKLKLPDICMYAKDLFLTIFWILFSKDKIDVYIGSDNLNAFAGLTLKILGRVKKVIFYTIDYVPIRFKNKLLNKIYHYIDYICIKYCDKTWNLSSAMADGREKMGIPSIYKNKQLEVPLGTDMNIDRVEFSKINKHEIAFMGHLREKQGIDFLIDAFPEIIKKIPDAKLVIIGGGPLQKHLEEQAKKLNLQNHIEFTGFIEDHKQVLNRLAKCAIGIAPYLDDNITFTKYSDPGKPKAYLAAGLPVIITKVPKVAWQIDESKAGIAINYDKNELINAIYYLLNNKETLLKYRENALSFAFKYSWNNIFNIALEKSIIKEYA